MRGKKDIVENLEFVPYTPQQGNFRYFHYRISITISQKIL